MITENYEHYVYIVSKKLGEIIIDYLKMRLLLFHPRLEIIRRGK